MLLARLSSSGEKLVDLDEGAIAGAADVGEFRSARNPIRDASEVQFCFVVSAELENQSSPGARVLRPKE